MCARLNVAEINTKFIQIIKLQTKKKRKQNKNCKPNKKSILAVISIVKSGRCIDLFIDTCVILVIVLEILQINSNNSLNKLFEGLNYNLIKFTKQLS